MVHLQCGSLCGVWSAWIGLSSRRSFAGHQEISATGPGSAAISAAILEIEEATQQYYNHSGAYNTRLAVLQHALADTGKSSLLQPMLDDPVWTNAVDTSKGLEFDVTSEFDQTYLEHAMEGVKLLAQSHQDMLRYRFQLDKLLQLHGPLTQSVQDRWHAKKKYEEHVPKLTNALELTGESADWLHKVLEGPAWKAGPKSDVFRDQYLHHAMPGVVELAVKYQHWMVTQDTLHRLVRGAIMLL
jgi:hypothetical protein